MAVLYRFHYIILLKYFQTRLQLCLSSLMIFVIFSQYTFTGHMLAKQTQFEFGREIIVSYLPLSHSAAQFYDLMCGLVNGMSVFFARPDALKVSWFSLLCLRFAPCTLSGGRGKATKGTCFPRGDYWNYSPSSRSQNQVTATHLMIRYP